MAARAAARRRGPTPPAAVRTPNRGGPTRDSGRTGYPGNTDPALPCGAEEQSKESTGTYSQTVADDYPSSPGSAGSPHPEMRRSPHRGTGERAGPARRRRSGTVVVTRRYASAGDGGRWRARSATNRPGAPGPAPLCPRRTDEWNRVTHSPVRSNGGHGGGCAPPECPVARQVDGQEDGSANAQILPVKGTVCDEHRVRAALALPATVCISWSESSGETVRASPLPRCLQ
jgi:hypothetical protein